MILRNEKEREQFLLDYSKWGICFSEPRLNAAYYKYDFEDGSKIIVAEYTGKIFEKEYKSTTYHLVKKGKDFSPFQPSFGEMKKHIAEIVPRR